jgi:hypothetical protein
MHKRTGRILETRGSEEAGVDEGRLLRLCVGTVYATM